MTVTLGLVSLAEKYVLPLINKGIEEIMQAFGVSEEDAKDIMANEIIQFAESVGIGALTLRLKLPTKIAERLGFSSKGFAKRSLSPKAKAKVSGTGTVKTTKVAATAGEVAQIAEVTAKARGLNGSLVSSLFNNILKVAGLTTGMFFAAAQYIDFANWQGPYQKTFQKILENFGLKVDTPLPKASVISDDIWKRVYSTIEQLDPIGISFPFSGIDKIYSRAALADLINEIASQMILEGQQPTFKNVMAIVLPLIQLSGKVKSLPTTTTGTPKATASTPSVPTVKVFTGIVSQGTLGKGLEFQARPDDLIENLDELRTAAANNLAPFLASLPSKVVYEVKVVSSIVTKDGFRQRGTTQQVLTGYYKNGQPKYKTVTNKFATLILYILTDKGSRTKITSVVLGPVDSARLQVGANDITALEKELPKLVTTQDVNEINTIFSDTPTDVVQNEPAPVEEVWQEPAEGEDTGYRFYSFTVNGEEYLEVLPWVGNIPTGHTPITQNTYLQKSTAMIAANPARWKPFFEQQYKNNANAFTGGKSGFYIKDGVPYHSEDVFVSATAPAVSSGSKATTVTPANATTLSAWYQAQGKSLPSVQVRAELYEKYGLGSRSYYTGTAEQNTRLLSALKSGTNVPDSAPKFAGVIVDNSALMVQ